MCDPVTAGVVLGAGAGTAAYTAGTATLMTAVSVGMTVGSGVMQIGAAREANKQDKIAAGLQKQQYQSQADRYKAQAEARDNEMQRELVDRKRQYLQNLSSNQAWMGTTGATMDSGSFRALLQDNYETYKDDASAIGLMGTEAKYESLSMARDSLTAKASVDPLLKSKQKARTLNTLSSVGGQLAEVGTDIFGGSTPKSRKPRNELKRTASTQSYEKLRKSLLGKEYGY